MNAPPPTVGAPWERFDGERWRPVDILASSSRTFSWRDKGSGTIQMAVVGARGFRACPPTHERAFAPAPPKRSEPVSMPPSVAAAVIRIAEEHETTVEAIVSASRLPRIVRARDHAMAVTRWSTGFSYPELGRLFGGRDHSTVIDAVKRHEARLNATRAA